MDDSITIPGLYKLLDGTTNDLTNNQEHRELAYDKTICSLKYRDSLGDVHTFGNKIISMKDVIINNVQDGHILSYEDGTFKNVPIDTLIEIPSECNLIEIDEGNGAGFALKDYNPENKGNIGLRAVDLSFSNSASETRGSTGNYSHAEGVNTTASGLYSHAEGRLSKAEGGYSHAEGSDCTASGVGSHAEGMCNTANGFGSHAEGSGTKALGFASHAEGTFSITRGVGSHIEGSNNEILETAPEGAHAEGAFCNPVGQDKQSVIGIGAWNNRKDGRIMWTDGTMTLPESTPTLISARGAKAVVTVEQVKGITDNKSDKGHNHDDRYYTESEVDSKLSANSTTDRDRSNHTGTQPASTISDLNSVGDARWVNKSGDTMSGNLVVPNAIADTHAVNRQSVKNANIGALTTASGAIQATDSINTAVSKVNNNAGLTRGTEGANTGYWLSGDNRANKGNIGSEAVDLSFSNTASPARGSTGKYSHAEGWGTIASGSSSHAEGRDSTAIGDYSHAEGGYTTAEGNLSHAEGSGTTASGSVSHAEGSGTTAKGHNSHAEGVHTTAEGSSSHAEGRDTIASGTSSHAEGWGTVASGERSHAEGRDTTASGYNSHAEGSNTTASGTDSHAEGRRTIAGGGFSHAEGIDNEILETATYGAHVEGRYCNPVGQHKQSVIGIGTSENNRKDGRIMWTDGTMTLPESTVPKMRARGRNSVSTLEITVQQVSDIKSLPTNTTQLFNGIQFSVAGFYPDSNIGGGLFVWDETRDKAEHNGGTVIAPDALMAWDGSQAGLASYLDWTGSGSGCFVKEDKGYVTPEDFGYIHVVTNNDVAIRKSFSLGGLVRTPFKELTVSSVNNIFVPDGTVVDFCGATITCPSNMSLPDEVGSYGRFSNHLFSRLETTAQESDVVLKNAKLNIRCLKVNFFGATSTTQIRDQHTGWIKIQKITGEGPGTPSGLGGPSATNNALAGAVINVSGYKVAMQDIDVSDFGQPIICISSKIFYARKIKTLRSSVSKDYTTWSNAAHMLIRSSEVIDVDDFYGELSGGSSLFASFDGSGGVTTYKSVKLRKIELVGCGLSAIPIGVRNYAGVSVNTDYIDMSGVIVRGWDCAIGADLHSGVSAWLDADNGSTVDSVRVDADIDYLAPWEVFDESVGAVSVTYNQNKTKGFDVGSQAGFRVGSFLSSKFVTGEVNINVTVKNHQRQGFLINNCKRVIGSMTSINCGWSKKTDNTLWQLSSPFTLLRNDFVNINLLNIKNNFLCVPDIAWGAPVLMSENKEVILLYSGSEESGVRCIRVSGGGEMNLVLKNVNTSVAQQYSGRTFYISYSTGEISGSDLIRVTRPVDKLDVTMGGGDFGDLSTTWRQAESTASQVCRLPKTIRANKNKIRIKSRVGGQVTVTPFSGETIDGLVTSLVISDGESVTLYSDGASNWITL